MSLPPSVQLADDAAELPDLDVVVLNQKGGEFERFGVILALQVMPSDDMPTCVEDKCPIVHVTPN
jgi:hypothetical protein